MRDLGTYHRIGVINGHERENNVTRLEPGDIMTRTKAYLDDVPVSSKLDRCIDSLRAPDGIYGISSLKELGEIHLDILMISLLIDL